MPVITVTTIEAGSIIVIGTLYICYCLCMAVRLPVLVLLCQLLGILCKLQRIQKLLNIAVHYIIEVIYC